MKNKTNFLNAFLFSSLSLISLAQASNTNQSLYTNEEIIQAVNDVRNKDVKFITDDLIAAGMFEDIISLLDPTSLPNKSTLSPSDSVDESQKALALLVAQSNGDEDLEKAMAASRAQTNTEINNQQNELKKAEDEELAQAIAASLAIQANPFLNTTDVEDSVVAPVTEAEDEELAQAIAASLAVQANPFSNTTDVEDGVVAPVRGGLMNRLSNLEQSRRNITANDTTDELAQRLQRRRDLNGEDR